MKKLMVTLIALAIAAVLVGCGGGGSNSDDNKNMVVVKNGATIPCIVNEDEIIDITLKVYPSNHSRYNVIVDTYKSESPEEAVYAQDTYTGEIYFVEASYDKLIKKYVISTPEEDFILACPGDPSAELGSTWTTKSSWGDVESISASVGAKAAKIKADTLARDAYPITYTYKFPYGTYKETKYWCPYFGWFIKSVEK